MIRIAIFASGQGTNAIRLIERAQSSTQVQVVLLVVDQEQAPVIFRVRELAPDLPQLHVFSGSRTERESKILAALQEARVDWCFLAGYLRVLSPRFVQALKKDRPFAPIVNIHPSLLPRFPGLQAIEKTFESGDAVGGVTVHLVDEGVDTGPVIAARPVSRLPDDSLQTFTERIKQAEAEIYPAVLEMISKNPTLIAIPDRRDPAHAQLYWVQYTGSALLREQWESVSKHLHDEVDQEFWVNPDLRSRGVVQVVDVLPGVTDNPAKAFAELLGFHPLFSDRKVEVSSGEMRVVGPELLSQLKVNPLVGRLRSFSTGAPALGSLPFRLLSRVGAESDAEKTSRFDLRSKSESELVDLSQKQHWALSAAEMKVIQNHFGDRAATDVEMEILAQSWSEHCKHKIFRAQIHYEDTRQPERSRTIRGLFKEMIQAPTERLKAVKPWLVSVFSDNAGIVRFFDPVDVCIKVETHNSPSALDPYGGALTGILGVNRDILGTGIGAKPIANTNVLCFGNPEQTTHIPVGLFPPAEVLRGVHRGIQDGGNKSGIPTVNGAILFDESYSGKPLVYCGTIGVLPQTLHGNPTHLKRQKPGDLIVVVGGAVGLDGIHGATSSSLGLDSSTPTGMVQIGDPLTQKRVIDFVLHARDLGLYSSITDNGAGGLSSSVGEMSELTGGARLDLSQVPLKYPGLAPWQIMVSESQERMTLAVPPQDLPSLLQLAEQWGVLAAPIGEFTASGSLEVFFGSQKVAHLDLKFLHEGLPPLELRARWSGPRVTPRSEPSLRLPLELPAEWKGTQAFKEHLLQLAQHPSLRSKESWIRQYDHEVQAATVIKPFEGTDGIPGQSAPNEGGLIWMGAHGARSQDGGISWEGVAIGSGIAAYLTDVDPEWMAICAVDEAVRNVLVTGADPGRVALTDNFCWPDPLKNPKNPEKNPDAEQKLAELVRAGLGLERVVSAYQMPLVSGKDSMKNDFYGADPSGNPVKISVLPTLLVTALAYHPDVRAAVRPHFSPGETLYRLGRSWTANDFDPEAVLQMYQRYYACVQSGEIRAARDVSEGGVAFAVTEGCLLHRAGLTLETAARELFAESPGQFLVSVDPSKEATFLSSFLSFEITRLGKLDDTAEIRWDSGGGTSVLRLDEFESAYRLEGAHRWMGASINQAEEQP